MNKVVQSFSKSGQPHDNAVMESFFASMKREEIYRTQYKSEQQFKKVLIATSSFTTRKDRTALSTIKRQTNLRRSMRVRENLLADLDKGVQKRRFPRL